MMIGMQTQMMRCTLPLSIPQTGQKTILLLVEGLRSNARANNLPQARGMRITSTAHASRQVSSNSTIEPQQQQQQQQQVPPIPTPTWSIASLELEKQHAVVDPVVLQALAKRALIDLQQFNDIDKAAIQQDVGNMIHMMNQVVVLRQQQQQKPQQQSNQAAMDNDDLQEKEATRLMYDVPRNVQAAPMRTSNDDDDAKQQQQQVWDSLLAPKTQRVGGHLYFVIPTSHQSK